MTVVQNDIVQSPNQYNIMMGEIFQCKPLLVEECQNGKLYMFDLQRFELISQVTSSNIHQDHKIHVYKSQFL